MLGRKSVSRWTLVGTMIGASFGGTVVTGASGAVSTSAVIDTDAPTCVVSETLVNSCRPWLGASANKYPQVGNSLRVQTEYHEQRIGKQLDIVHAYNGANTDGLSGDELYFASRPNTILFLNWKPVGSWLQADGSNASVNATIDEYAASIQSLGDTKIFLTLNHEPENDVSGSIAGCTIKGHGNAGTPADYRAMWRNVRDRFDALGVTNVVWAVDYMSKQSFNCMIDDLYPGNDLVDWVFFDNYGSGKDRSFDQNVGRMYDLFTNSSDAAHDYLSKPWGIAEWNIRNGQVTQQQIYNYYDEATAALETSRFPKIKAYMVYDSVGPDGNENRILYSNSGGLDPQRQEHYAAFANSPEFAATVPPEEDNIPPTPPTMQGVTANGSGVNVDWLASTDNVVVADYEVFRDGQALGSTRNTSFLDTTVQTGNTYSYTVRATDNAGNASEFSDAMEVTVTDVTAPTTPGAPNGVVNPDDSVTVSWGPSTDDTGVDRYELWRGGSFLTDSIGVTFTDSTTHQGQKYTYTVYAIDAVGNRSNVSAPATITVPDTIAPTAPTSLHASSPTRRTVRLTWTAGSDNVGIQGYYVYRGTTRIATISSGTATGYTVNNLTSGQTYAFSVRAFDAARNQSPASNSASVRVR